MAHGSAFLYRLDGKDYVVTARHNLTNNDWPTNRWISKPETNPTHLRVLFFGDSPDKWRIKVSQNSPRVANIQVLMRQHLLPLIGADWKPIWKQHPTHGTDMDVAVLPLSPPEDVLVMPWERPAAQDDLGWPQLSAGQDLFIVGYPYHLSTGPNFPLWIRGTVASEPAFGYSQDGKTYPLWLADARTRKGQSGSPVMRYRPTGTALISDGVLRGFTGGPDSELVGVYSGRTSDESDLGFVWDMNEVDAICRDGVPGTVRI